MLGKSVPDFSVAATSGQTVTLSALRGQTVILYFYPKDNTPGCTTEGQDFTALNAEFTAAGAVIFGISRDSVKSHEGFKAKLCMPFELLSDSDEALCKLFDVIKLKNMYGKQVLGIERSTFVIDKDGKLVREWRKVKVAGHAKEVLDFVKTL
ncbi:peroxiredoxin [Uliginosibacterium sediminicola]|uniref:thioredoxin-dependent peroxiredoxin n=1 Tax=Uliginosibacterium sediminicola TaxID=2024550 RepID=A0ABU9YZ69_9RHOO